jgi:hypothetical protein
MAMEGGRMAAHRAPGDRKGQRWKAPHEHRRRTFFLREADSLLQAWDEKVAGGAPHRRCAGFETPENNLVGPLFDRSQ